MKVQKIMQEYAGTGPRFGGVVLDVERAPRPGGGELLVSFGSYVQPEEAYHAAARAGIEYFFGRYAPAHPGDLLVEVLGFHELAGETTAAIITYATVRALEEACQFAIEGVGFDAASGALQLPAAAGQAKQ